MRYTINMLSGAHKVKGQGVSSAYDEQVALARQLDEKFDVSENKLAMADITHYHTINPQYILTFPLAGLRGARVGYVHFLPETVDGSLHLWKPFQKAFYWYLLRFYKSMDYLVTVNPDFISHLAAYGIDPQKVTYIPNYVSSERFHPLPQDQISALRQQFGLEPDRFTVCCAGQLQTRKGIFDFIRLAERMPSFQFIWAGGFSFGNITEGYKEIKEKLENPPANLHFTGILEREQMNDFYNIGDVMFLPSYDELFPMTILEAMCCGKPILLRDIDIYKNILFDFYLKGNDLDDFEKQLRRLQEDPAFYQQACQMAQKGNAFYSKEHVLEMWDQFYSRVASDVQENRARHKQHRLTKGTNA
ncbi:MAG TPA: glycosyltransferase family 4 protein [Firmicutes bacterium]|nr:glycosyltransferase family 4 protein [Bacillota bacterium]